MNPPLLAAMVPGEDAVPSPQLIIAVKSLAAPFRFPSLKFATTPLKAAPCMAVKITLVAVSRDDEHNAFELTIEDRSQGYPRKYKMGVDFVASGEYEVRRAQRSDDDGNQCQKQRGLER